LHFVAYVQGDEQRRQLLDDAGIFELSTVERPRAGNFLGQLTGQLSRALVVAAYQDRKSTRLNSSHGSISYAVFCLKKKNHTIILSTAFATHRIESGSDWAVPVLVPSNHTALVLTSRTIYPKHLLTARDLLQCNVAL